jgi:hypothetical protein
MFDDTNFFFAFGDFEFGNAGFLDKVDEFFEFTQIHKFSPSEFLAAGKVWPASDKARCLSGLSVCIEFA